MQYRHIKHTLVVLDGLAFWVFGVASGELMGMETERREFTRLVRQSRRSQGLTQADLAGRVGITNGALSRYESGDVGVVGDATLRSVCEALQLVGPAWLAGAGAGPAAERPAGELARYYCPTPFCPLNQVFMTPGWIHFMPQQVESCAAAEVVCQWCGAALQSRCLNCGADLVEGSGVCVACGAEYVPAAPVDEATLRVLQFSPPAVAKLSRPAAGLPFWQPRAAGAGAGMAGSALEPGRPTKGGGPSHGGAA